jgi:hypothetical protein
VEVEMEVEAEVESEDIIDSKKASLVDLFSQMFIKENFDANAYLQAHMTPSTQTIPMSAICQVRYFIVQRLQTDCIPVLGANLTSSQLSRAHSKELLIELNFLESSYQM